eukprot:628099-Prymnesium_polylepis.2
MAYGSRKPRRSAHTPMNGKQSVRCSVAAARYTCERRARAWPCTWSAREFGSGRRTASENVEMVIPSQTLFVAWSSRSR